jgi:CheY-like chemotaxis protein
MFHAAQRLRRADMPLSHSGARPHTDRASAGQRRYDARESFATTETLMSSEENNERLAHVRIIVVEDSFPVADGLKFLLQTFGCTVAGMAGNVRSALDLVARSAFDVALLDIDLRGEHVTPIAEAVRRRGKPLIFLTGYGDAEILPAHLRALPRLEKPVEPTELLAAIHQALESTDAE